MVSLKSKLLTVIFGIAWFSFAAAAAAAAVETKQGMVEQGKYLATAGDCAACHGASMSGGNPIASPIGKIYASNITPDKTTGIGSWSLQQFADALRKGKGSKGHLYPAMPYTSYTGLDDQQIEAMYSYFMQGVAPVSNAVPETELPFPFVRPAMMVWNGLFLKEGQAVGAVPVDAQPQERGRVLVESLGHCTACHTPRGDLMQEKSRLHLSGAFVAGWWAPNITPGAGGISEWSDEKLTNFLRTGHTTTAIAAGEMGTVVSRSLSKLTPDDLKAVVSYLRAVPAVDSDASKNVKMQSSAPVLLTMQEPSNANSLDSALEHATTSGALLYQNACASCHGFDGNGSAKSEHPSLRQMESVVGPEAATLIQVIAHGVNRKVGDNHAVMPAFRQDLSDQQIASLSNYLRSDFGGIQSDVNAAGVASILGGETKVPWLIKNATCLSVLGIALFVLALIAVGWMLSTRRRGRARA